MCGITGILLQNRTTDKVNLSKMINSLKHRGPDNSGVWLNEKSNFGICHSRLSILDLSSAGSQPMHSKNKRYVISFNGEIYNHIDLRTELKSQFRDIIFNGNSDTETILNCIEKWGLKPTLEKMVGMFSIAIWDRKKKILKLVRDRFGEKPMYYGWIDNAFYFGSELKPIKKNPYFKLEIDRTALNLFIKYSYIPQPFSIYKNIKKLKPGLILSVNANKEMIFDEYWSLNSVVKPCNKEKWEYDDSQTTNLLEKKLLKSVNLQKLSDVPLGAFLSGGIDSSLIVSMMQLNSSVSVNSFTIGFDEKLYNEANYAAKVAKHLNTNHNELYVSDKNVRDVIPLIPQIYDEPFADSSQLPTYLVSKLARSKVKVALSGDGGDELFGGYNRYVQAPRLYKVPKPIRYFSSGLIRMFSPEQLGSVHKMFKSLIPSTFNSSSPVNHLLKIANVFDSSSEWEVYDKLVSISHDSKNIVINNEDDLIINNNLFEKIPNLEYENKMMYSDILTYLTDDILCKVDRAAMAVSLETRTPFLDRDVVEFAWQLPINMKIRNGEGKWILKKILNKYIPKNLIDRPKMGFGIPIENWLRGPLREWAEELLSKKHIVNDGFFNYHEVYKLWDDHLKRKKNNQYILWNILVFQSWKNKWL
jgi:asparagine synthase (glutamine-hydrolysing)